VGFLRLKFLLETGATVSYAETVRIAKVRGLTEHTSLLRFNTQFPGAGGHSRSPKRIPQIPTTSIEIDGKAWRSNRSCQDVVIWGPPETRNATLCFVSNNALSCGLVIEIRLVVRSFLPCSEGASPELFHKMFAFLPHLRPEALASRFKEHPSILCGWMTSTHGHL